MSTLQTLSYRTWFLLMGGLAPVRVLAQRFGGPVPDIEGTPDAASQDDIRDLILTALEFVLDFLALAAVVFIVIAGIRLIFSQGSDEQKDKAKKTILFVIIGLLVILFARVIVGFFTETVSQEFGG